MTKDAKEIKKNMQRNNIPGEETAAQASTFPDLKYMKEMPTAKERNKKVQSNLARQAISIIDKINPPAPTPNSLAEAMASDSASELAKACNAEVVRHTDDFSTWNLEEPIEGDKPLPYVMTFHSKTNQCGGLEKHKVRCAIRRDRMRPGLHFDETRTASHMTPQAGRRFFSVQQQHKDTPSKNGMYLGPT